MDFKSDTMRLHNRQGAAYLTFDSLSAVPFIRHAFSTRLGGVSTGEFSTMNLSFGRGDADENVLQNYRLFCESAGFDFDSLTASPYLCAARYFKGKGNWDYKAARHAERRRARNR